MTKITVLVLHDVRVRSGLGYLERRERCRSWRVRWRVLPTLNMGGVAPGLIDSRKIVYAEATAERFALALPIEQGILRMAASDDPEHPAVKVTALIGLGADGGSEKPKGGDIRVADFDGSNVRGRFYKGEWWISIIDMLTALKVSAQPARYWNELSGQLVEKEGFSELFGKIEKLKMPSADGKMRGTEAVNVETLLRILQSVPSAKLEPLKQWLAKVGFERIQEAKDPAKTLERLINLYLTKGRTPQWIRERIDGIITRRELTDEWRDRGITSEYSKLTRMLQLRSIGLGPKEHRELKGLEDHHSLRDHSTEMELILTRLGERSTIEIARARNAQGYEQNRDAVQAGGDIAKTARKRIEKLTGKPVASKQNFLPKQDGPAAIT